MNSFPVSSRSERRRIIFQLVREKPFDGGLSRERTITVPVAFISVIYNFRENINSRINVPRASLFQLCAHNSLDDVDTYTHVPGSQTASSITNRICHMQNIRGSIGDVFQRNYDSRYCFRWHY